MSFARPSLSTLLSRVAADLQSALPGTNPFLRRSLITIIGKMVAGAVHGLYGFQQWIARQILMDTCDAEVLARWGGILGVPQKAASAATGDVVFIGTSDKVVPTGTALTRSDGWTFTTTADGTVVNGTVTVPVVASTAGAAGDCAPGMALACVSPIAGVNSSATVDTAGIGDGADAETTDAWRLRVLARMQKPPRAGTSPDYVEWALAVPGVTRAWSYPQELGAGTVTVRCMTDDAADGPFPDASTITALQAQLDAVAPVGCTPSAYAPIAAPLNPEIHIVPDTTVLRASVTAALADLLLREAIPGGTIPLTHFADAIGDVVGITDYTLTSPSAAVVEPAGSMTTLGTITWA